MSACVVADELIGPELRSCPRPLGQSPGQYNPRHCRSHVWYKILPLVSSNTTATELRPRTRSPKNGINGVIEGLCIGSRSLRPAPGLSSSARSERCHRSIGTQASDLVNVRFVSVGDDHFCAAVCARDTASSSPTDLFYEKVRWKRTYQARASKTRRRVVARPPTMRALRARRRSTADRSACR